MPNQIVRIATKFFAVAILFATIPALATHAQNNDQDAASLARAAGCGASDVKFNVKTEKNQHPTAQPESGKAIVYIYNAVRTGASINIGSITVRVGLDGEWVGANHGQSYFYFPVELGDHRICAQWQSSIGRLSKLASAASLSAEPGQTYYLRAFVDTGTHGEPFVKLEPLDPAEAILISANSAFSTSQPKK
jgi:hypothetical protein